MSRKRLYGWGLPSLPGRSSFCYPSRMGCSIGNWADSDYDQLVSLSAQQSPPIDPVQVAITLFEEGGMNPACDPFGGSGSAGMNGMDEANLQSMGLTKAQWLAMSVSTQLGWIFKIWQSWAKTYNGGQFPTSAGALLGLNFLPGQFKLVGAGSNPNAVLAGKNGPQAGAYASNAPLQNSSGTITVNTLNSYLAGVASRGGTAWQNVVARIEAAEQRAGEPETALASQVSPVPSTPAPAVDWGTVAATVVGGVVAGSAAWYVWENRRFLTPVRRRYA